ncbi:MAG: metallophosphoesterase [Desulfobacterales bacterium]|jgi:hypothetical protein|nr:metallophosphoesterase [Desulfobacterales bacterium]
MKIAVMSDSHDHIWNLRKALDTTKSEKCSMIIHCGDFVAPFVFKEFLQAGIPVHCVFGNNDGDRYLLTRFALESDGLITLSPMIGTVDAGNLKIAFAHEWAVAEGLAATGKYDLVCYGHSHQHALQKIGGTLAVNPGEIMGKDGEPGFCIVDTDEISVRRIIIS